MFKHSVLALTLSASLSGCSGEGNETANTQPAPSAKGVATNIHTTSAPIESRILLKGEQPVTGLEAPKSIVWFSTLSEFEGKWMDFTSQAIPAVSFPDRNVVLLDLGGERDVESCGNKYRFDGVEAELLTTSFTGKNGEQASRKTTVVTINTTQCLSTMVCTDILIPARPFAFVSIPTEGEVILKEEVSFSGC